jgi:DNA-binding ferritin-like protein
MGRRDQLRMNHWQTFSYAEHKTTDNIIKTLNGYIDKIGETALGIFGRPKMNSMSNTISDINIVSTEHVIEQTCDETKALLEECRVTDNTGITVLLEDMVVELDKFKYLVTLD